MKPLQSASGGLGLVGGRRPLPTIGNLGQEYKSDDPIRQGFFDSTFFKPNARSTADVVNYTYQGNPMGGSSSQISQFRNYLDSIGKGDLLVNQNSGALAQVGSGPLATSTPGQYANTLNNSNFSFNTSNPLNQVTPPEIPVSMQQPIPGLGAPPQGIGSLTPTPQQPGIGGLLGSGNAQPPQGINEPGFNDQLTGIKSLSEFGNPPSLGGNSFGNPLIGNTLGWNNSFQPTQQGFNNNNNYNQELNSYVDNTINGRLKNIFSGIMGLLT